MLLHSPSSFSSIQPRCNSTKLYGNVCDGHSNRVRRGCVSRVQVKANTQPTSDKASNVAVATQQQQRQQQQHQEHQQQQQQHEDIVLQLHRGSSGAAGATAIKAGSSSNNVVPFRRRLATPVNPDSSSSSSSSGVVAEPTTTVASPTSSSSSSCPFLQALQPPLVKLSWWQRIWQITQPMKMQSMVLDDTVAAGGAVVQLEQQLAFEAAYVPGTGAAVRHVLSGDSGSEPYTGPSLVPFFVRLMGEDSLLVVSGPKHKYLRGLLAPAFNPDSVARYTPQIVQLVQRHLQQWAAAGEGGVQGMDALKLLTFEFIVQLTFGRAYESTELQSLHSTYKEWINGLPAWPWLNIPFTPYAAALNAREAMMQHFQAEVAAGRAKLAAGEAVGGLLGDMLAAVDEEGNRLTDNQICDNILLMLFAGHDTSSTTLTHCLSNLQDHPAAMQQLRAEQAAVVAKHGDTITAAALKDMHYAESVIKETLRRDPVVAMLFRVALRDFELAGYTVPQGKQLLLPLKYLSAHDSRWSSETGDWSPDAFEPERMLTLEGQKAGDLMPFGHGGRYCLGSGLAMSEMKVLLALLARQYTFSADSNTEWINSIGKVPKNGLPLIVRPLQQ